jgi:hypothetical protein
MSSQDTSFNASGQTVVAFETINNGPRAFGAGVNGSRCGVHGEGMASPQGSRSVTVSAVGVHGRGDFYGVYGIAGTIPSGNAPELGSEPFAPIGVIGVSDPQNSAPAVLGDNGVLKDTMTQTGVEQAMSTIAKTAVGVIGVSGSNGGVAGVAGIDQPKGQAALNFVNGNLASNGLAGFNSAITAVAAGPSPGVYGISVGGGRGGIFQSFIPNSQFPQVAAQIQLVPTPATPITGTRLPNLLKFGQAGDLTAVVVTLSNAQTTNSLWFCVQSFVSDQNPAKWAEITLGAPIDGGA